MITLLHGNYIESSRKELNTIRQSLHDKEIRYLNGKDTDTTVLVQALESSSLFDNNVVVIIDLLFSKLGKQQKRIQEYCTILAQNSKTKEIILWEDRELSPTILKMLGPNVRNILCKLPILVFQFLDALLPQNAKIVVGIYNELKDKEPPELIFSMMNNRIRQLIQLKDSVIPEGLSPWQKNRLTTQAKSFTMRELTDIYRRLFDMEIFIKTGTSPFTISEQIEYFCTQL